jgi:hypothetical protein
MMSCECEVHRSPSHDAQEPEEPVWHVIQCPANLVLTSIGKERGTHGFIYTIWEVERRFPVWVSQSIPAVVKAINDKAVTAHEKRLHASSIYRVLRGESQKRSHKHHSVCRWSRTNLVELNAHLKSFPSCIFVSKSPEQWCVSTAPVVPPPQLASAAEATTMPPGGGGGDEGGHDKSTLPDTVFSRVTTPPPVLQLPLLRNIE